MRYLVLSIGPDSFLETLKASLNPPEVLNLQWPHLQSISYGGLIGVSDPPECGVAAGLGEHASVERLLWQLVVGRVM